MSLKNSFYKLVMVLFCIGVYSCNSSKTETVIEGVGGEGQIASFSVKAKPVTATDTLTYPFLGKAFFTILSDKATGYNIFNLDSLPVRTDIRTVEMKLTYTATPSAVDLVYLNKSREDSVVSWNSSDSVKFIFDDLTQRYYPKLNVISRDGLTKRLYDVDFRIHNVNPDSIVWERPNIGGNYFVLPQSGESRVIADANLTRFYALIKSDTKIYFYSSSIQSPGWTAYDLNLPSNTVVKSLVLNAGVFSVLTTDGTAYQFFANDLTQKATAVVSDVEYKNILGVLPNLGTNVLNELLVLCYNNNGELIFAKTKDFKTIENITVSGSTTDLVGDEFPISSYASTYIEINKIQYILLTGGYSIHNKLVNNSWFITNNSLVDNENNKKASVAVLPGKSTNDLPYDLGITTFVYNDSIQAFSGDSLRLYTSKNGQKWSGISKDNILVEGMKNLNVPSIIVDKENYIWVMGGQTPQNDKGAGYYRDIWRGRMNKMTFKPIDEQ